MDYQQLIESMTPEVYQSLRRAVELGRWPDGSRLSSEQRQECLQAVIAWGERHLPPEQRVGFIDRGRKAGEICDDPEPTPLSWRD
jgi:uncharacterized protein YeaC (DUF1315 family)